MIAPLIGLHTAIAMSHNIAMSMLSFGANGIMNMNKYSQMKYANNSLMYRIALTQEESYRKLLHQNIKRSFSTFA